METATPTGSGESDPIKQFAIDLTVNLSGATKLVVEQLVVRLRQDAQFRQAVLFGLDGGGIGISAQPTPEVAEHIYTEVLKLVEGEREACAQVALDYETSPDEPCCENTAHGIAEAIAARGGDECQDGPRLVVES